MMSASRFLAFLLSLSLHGVLASLLFSSFQKVPVRDPITMTIEWESSPQAATSPTKREMPLPIAQSSSVVQTKKKRAMNEGSSLPRWERAPKERVGSYSPSYTSPTKEQKNMHNGDHEITLSNNKETVISKKSFQPLPKYPWICRKRGQEGCVCLAVQTNKQGHVISAILHKSSGHLPLDQSALTAVKAWVFIDGPCQKILTISFQLKESIAFN